MKIIFILCGLILVLGGIFVWRQWRLPVEYGTFIGAPKTEVIDLIEKPKDYLNKTVAIQGIIKKQCTTMGCYFFFESGNQSLRVDISELAMNAPMKNGHMAQVEGQIVPYDDGFQFWASAVHFE